MRFLATSILVLFTSILTAFASQTFDTGGPIQANLTRLVDDSVVVRTAADVFFLSKEGELISSKTLERMTGSTGTAIDRKAAPLLLKNGNLWVQKYELDSAGNIFRSRQGGHSQSYSTTGVELPDGRLVVPANEDANYSDLFVMGNEDGAQYEIGFTRYVTSDLAILNNGKVIWGTRFGTLGEFDPRTNKVREIELAAARGMIQTKPLVLSNGLIVLGTNGRLFEGEVLFLNAEDYSVVKVVKTQAVRSTPVVIADSFVVIAEEGLLEDGGRVDVFSLSGKHLQTLILDERTSLAIGVSADLLALKDGAVIVPAENGKLYKLVLKEGRFIVQKTIHVSEHPLRSRPVELNDGRIVVADEMGIVHFLTKP